MKTNRRLAALLSAAAAVAVLARPAGAVNDPRLKGAARGARGGWITIRLEGTPAEIGYQHGRLLAREIEDALAVARLSLTHDGKRDWKFYRQAAQTVFWPGVDAEVREEIEGIVEGATQAGVKADVWDLVVLNANLELSYYTDSLAPKTAHSSAPEKCSAFVATGRFTKDAQPVVAHNNWSGYLDGARWNVVFDIRPSHGQRILMDGYPGLVHSGDDFGINAAGLVVTETTITGFKGFDVKGVPEFVRARKALQYATSIDDFERIMRAGNNGGYANAWLVADTKTGEIARLELGLTNVTLERTKDGYFTGANFPVNPKLAAEETTFKLDDPGLSANARRVRAEQLMRENAGRIDLALAKAYLSDHYDTYEKKADAPSERSLCGHVELSARGMGDWFGPWGPAGTVQAKVSDAALAKRMAFEAAVGHPCGRTFSAAEHLARHPEWGWLKPLLRDLPGGAWTPFEAAP
jgi:hypothetical protein